MLQEAIVCGHSNDSEAPLQPVTEVRGMAGLTAPGRTPHDRKSGCSEVRLSSA
jgi:hypothetical protein